MVGQLAMVTPVRTPPQKAIAVPSGAELSWKLPPCTSSVVPHSAKTQPFEGSISDGNPCVFRGIYGATVAAHKTDKWVAVREL